jgi:hypothetical protein
VTDTYSAMVTQIAGSSLASTAQSFAEQGYVITAATTNTAGYTVWGFKRDGDTTKYTAQVAQVAGSSLASTAQSFAQEGFVINTATTNTAGYTVWGFKAVTP